ncbi:MAG TPA: DUF2064 domain-containing protein [candidate division Zixibacteria bacterium]|nr:DUF2064 domain-containing protein [candidate division Zixibacteria bacterium]HEQ99623.1 DUF2064 domain-containing protein [candidate division Zixibacteria bacterium]
MPAKKKQQALIIFLEDSNRDIIHSKLTDYLSQDEKNKLYSAFLEDTIYTCLNLKDVLLKINYPSEAARCIINKSIQGLEKRLPPKLIKTLKASGVEAEMIKGKSQGERLKHAFEQTFTNGHSPVLLIGCVTPTLSKKVLQDAYRKLKRSDVVFGPTLEGSYYLVGLNRLENDVFENVEWAGDKPVYSQMVGAVSGGTLNWQELELWYDLRQPEDFEFLIRDINFFRQIGDENSASKTEEVLNEILKKMP